MTLDLKKGDPWPFRSVRGFTGNPIPTTWHALITAPQREAKTARQLEAAGVRVVYPQIERVRHVRGVKRAYTHPMISQIIYAEFRYAPQWDVMRDRRLITGVFSAGIDPVVLREDDIARVMGLPTEAERLEAERIEAERPKVGQRAEITEGVLKDFFVDVTRVEFGRVWYETATGIKGSAPEAMVRAAE